MHSHFRQLVRGDPSAIGDGSSALPQSESNATAHIGQRSSGMSPIRQRTPTPKRLHRC
ncbi:unnamed protein product [Sphacelaria rigidula]